MSSAKVEGGVVRIAAPYLVLVVCFEDWYLDVHLAIADLGSLFEVSFAVPHIQGVNCLVPTGDDCFATVVLRWPKEHLGNMHCLTFAYFDFAG